MEWLIWIGAAISLLGLAGIIGCIVAVVRARRAAIVALNIGALFVSVLGLMLIVVGVFLG